MFKAKMREHLGNKEHEKKGNVNNNSVNGYNNT